MELTKAKSASAVIATTAQLLRCLPECTAFIDQKEEVTLARLTPQPRLRPQADLVQIVHIPPVARALLHPHGYPMARWAGSACLIDEAGTRMGRVQIRLAHGKPDAVTVRVRSDSNAITTRDPAHCMQRALDTTMAYLQAAVATGPLEGTAMGILIGKRGMKIKRMQDCLVTELARVAQGASVEAARHEWRVVVQLSVRPRAAHNPAGLCAAALARPYQPSPSAGEVCKMASPIAGRSNLLLVTPNTMDAVRTAMEATLRMRLASAVSEAGRTLILLRGKSCARASTRNSKRKPPRLYMLDASECTKERHSLKRARDSRAKSRGERRKADGAARHERALMRERDIDCCKARTWPKRAMAADVVRRFRRDCACIAAPWCLVDARDDAEVLLGP